MENKNDLKNKENGALILSENDSHILFNEKYKITRSDFA